MNRDIIVFDFETGGRNPLTCQPTQVAALALDGRNFKLKGTFNSEIWAETDDEKAVAAGLGPIEDGALKVTGKTRESIAKAPKPKAVTELIEEAKHEGVKAVFTNPEVSDKVAKQIASEVGVPVIEISPLNPKWSQNLKTFAKAIANR